jgi:hypothetical protein
MNFTKVKESLQNDLLSRDLKDPSIRLNAIKSVKKLLKIKIEERNSDPINLLELLNKTELKNALSRFKKNHQLNGAEESISNEI